MKKTWCLLIAAAILCANSGFAYAQTENAVSENVSEADAFDDVQLLESVDGISMEYDFSRSTETERYVKVKYNSTYFTKGVDKFCIKLSIPTSNVVSIEKSTSLSSFEITDEYSGGIYTVTGAAAKNEKPSDGNLFTIKITLDSNLQSTKNLSLINGTYIGDELTTLYLDNGGINGASVALPVKSGQDFLDPSEGTSGTVSWSYSTGVLKISGSGTMADYEPGEAPWYIGADKIKKVEFTSDAIQNVGKNAFYGLTALTEIQLSAGIQTVGESAFEGCTNLRTITMPSILNAGLGVNSFKNCKSLTDVVIPSSVTMISKGAFEGCTGLTSLTIPFIGSEVGSRNNNNTFSYIFNDNVPTSLKTVIVTNETNIPEKAFADCKYISTITVNDGIKTIGASAFDGCSALAKFKIPEGITSIEDYTFRNCSSASEIIVPDSVQGIGEAAFDGCKSLKAVNIPNGVAEIKNYTFRNCSSIVNLVIPDTVENIRTDVLAGCNSLHTLKIPFVGANSDPGMTTITHEGVFGYLFGEGLGVSQGNKNYAIPASVTKVEVTHPDRDCYIPMGAFENCANLRDIIVDGGSAVLDRAFVNCRNLRNLYLPKSVDSIGETILEGCVNLETLTVPFIGKDRGDHGTETSVLGAFFGGGTSKTEKTDVHQYYNETESRWYHVPGTLKNVAVLNNTNIPYGAFMECYHLEQVSLVTGVVINDKAFYNCTALKDVQLPKDLRDIGYEAFAECEALENINIPIKAKSIGDYAFYNAQNLKAITIPKSVEDIADNVFAGTPFILNDADAGLMDASDAVIFCEAGSKAEEFAKENEMNYKLLSADELDVKKTSTTIKKHSDDTYFVEITDVNALTGTLVAALYDANGAIVNAKTIAANSENSNYHMEFTEEEVQGAVKAKIFIWNSLSGMSPEVSEAEVCEIQ